jgi:uncharacterized protein (DUF849 family)
VTAPILQACLNGSRLPDEHPRVPVLADELAAEAASAWMAGAHSVHVHPRDSDGHQTLAPGFSAEAIAAIRAASPTVEVSLSTAAFIDPDVDARIACIHAWTVLPDVASVNFSEDGCERISLALHQRGVPVEAGVASVPEALRLLDSGELRHCERILVEVADPDPQEAVAHAARIEAVLQEAMVMLPRLHHGEGRATWAVLVAAARAGRHIRIGLEDTLELPDGSVAASNEAMVRAASELQRRAARARAG